MSLERDIQDNCDMTQKIVSSLNFEWKPIGEILLNQNNRLVFSVSLEIKNIPAVYRFEILHKDGRKSLYIGEAKIINRRFGNYRTGSKRQKTSHRIRNVLEQVLQEGAEIFVSAVINNAFFDKGDGPVPIDLSSKSARCCLENAALIFADDGKIEILNK
jgi:hypothetical protein